MYSGSSFYFKMLVTQENKKKSSPKALKGSNKELRGQDVTPFYTTFPPPEIKKPLVIQKGGYFIFAGVGEVC